jgi:hypothetical protein
MATIKTKLSGRKGSRSGAVGITFVGLDRLMAHLAPDRVPHVIEGIAGFNTPYALAQHERLDFNHPKGGKAKYLEDPLKQNADRYGDHLAGRMREAVGVVGPVNAGEAVTAGAIRGMTEVTEDLLGRAMREAPLDEGTLRASGTAAVLVDGRRVSGSAAPEAVVT